MKFGLRYLLLFTAGVAFACVCGGIGHRFWFGVQAKRTTASVANTHVSSILGLALPSAARDVDFSAHFLYTDVEFSIDEAAFRAWCLKNEWTIDTEDGNRYHFSPANVNGTFKPGESRVRLTCYRG